ncbi:MAG: hypothetical protein A3A94_01920 [Candidatus Portnoybacteria bacterium RIFCSPLOWO2_01_FULL_43_11]|uniref:Transport permease protein n=3 Tax=Bacteria candidate phyla TaxID=1783234 RepID=A0A1G2FNE9_9BACT|nr:MAG: hypothetical protein A2713_01065 [candidate division WWE3 bacterium RIFCSPHIGHO2_01_FULL_35_17]OGZ36536.1 MAG: hypothetical protein A3D38_01045 [Candidatus Portnoybacteria bacterium RIFCSPHIGHO2_02_FULL_40_23]OGZ39060.1 MAG: hypothetical protein A3A94_01920 [Candidatus Portnoybacteria bacterium RIFCSPLOWO2_01_FULL_43_11]OGZ39337.1 MAG: hypothetical protein A3E90_01245 [Candidatus Portnoybacteria bacterium RIFCSPHIGHO2_12_FULL_40_11]
MITKEINAIFTIAFRDLIKLLRDRARVLSGFVFPFLFIGILGSSLNATIGENLGFNFLTFIFTGVFAQALFQSSAAGVISLVQDRENDFSQELFISPISRYSIILGKIFGETLVAYVAGFGVLIFGFIIGVPLTLTQIAFLIPAGLAACFLGGAFGILVLSNISSQRTVAQIFPFVLFPQIFLSGVFNPLIGLPPILAFFSRLTPLTYAVDLVRGAYYAKSPVFSQVVVFHPAVSLFITAALFFLFLFLGTFLFVRKERNK